MTGCLPLNPCSYVLVMQFGRHHVRSEPKRISGKPSGIGGAARDVLSVIIYEGECHAAIIRRGGGLEKIRLVLAANISNHNCELSDM